MTFGEYLKQHRKKLNLNKTDAAKRIGMDRSNYVAMENGRRHPGVALFTRLHEKYDVPMAAFKLIVEDRKNGVYCKPAPVTKEIKQKSKNPYTYIKDE